MISLVAAIRSVIRNSGTRQKFCIVSTSDEGLRGQISVLVCCKSERTKPCLCVYINTQFITCCRGAGTILQNISIQVFFFGSLYLLKVSATKFVLSKNGQSHSLTDPTHTQWMTDRREDLLNLGLSVLMHNQLRVLCMVALVCLGYGV